MVFQNPRKAFDDSVRYAVQAARIYLDLCKRCRPDLIGLRYLELGPGADFAPQLVLASHGVDVTLADKYLSQWDASYHPMFYEAFLEAWGGIRRASNSRLSSQAMTDS
jgi:hypothetical protein